MSSDVNNLPLITRVKYVAIFFLIAPMVFSLFVFNSYTDEAMAAFLWGEEQSCVPTLERKPIVYQKLRRVDKSPIYLYQQRNESIIISNEKLLNGVVYKCLVRKNNAFIYNDENAITFVTSYDRTYSAEIILWIFLAIFMGVAFLCWYLVLLFGSKRDERPGGNN